MMVRSLLFWKLFGVCALTTLAAATTLYLVAARWQEQLVQEHVWQRLLDAASMLASQATPHLEPLDELRLQRLAQQMGSETELRLTIVGPDGRVWADSDADPALAENHGARAEIVAAFQGRLGRSERHSQTVQHEMLYVASPVRIDGGIAAAARVAMPLDQLERQTSALRSRMLLVTAVITGLSLVCFTILVGRIVRPVRDLTTAAQAIAEGDYRYSIRIPNRDEFGKLADAFQEMRRQLARRLDQSLRQAQQLETVLGSMVEGVVAVDRQRRIILANDAACQLLEFGRGPVGNRPLWELVRHPAVEQVLNEGFERNVPQTCELEMSSRPRRVLALHVTQLPGQPCPGLVMVIDDVTELRRLERMRQDFIANVSHELKTPLSSIKAYSETLLNGAINDPEHNVLFLQRIGRQAERLEQLILDMLSLSRIESGHQPFEIEPLSIEQTVAELAALHAPAAESKQIRLVVESPAEPLRVWGEAEGLRQILDNLLNNAVKYTPDGGRVAVRWQRAGEMVELEVEDTGLGIAPADQERIFERFYRVDRARSRELGGTGLGLSIVKHLAQAFGGSVRVKSQLGRGSLFTVRLRAVLPVADVGDSPPDATHDSESPEQMGSAAARSDV